MCKFCVNGVGMYADISCGDLWNLDQNQRPEFTEGKGQQPENVQRPGSEVVEKGMLT